MEVVFQDEYDAGEHEKCPQCGNQIIVLTQFNDGAWITVCKNCQATPGSTFSKRQAKTNWKMFAEEYKNV